MAGEEKFILYLTDKKKNAYITLSRIFIIFNLLILILYFFWSEIWTALIPTVIFVILYLTTGKYRQKWFSSAGKESQVILAAIAVFWFPFNWMMGVFMLATFFVFFIAMKKLGFEFTREGMLKAYFPKRQFDWNEIDSVILKAGLLTVNFKNDNLLQGEVDNESSLNEDHFNSFVNDCIARAPDTTPGPN